MKIIPALFTVEQTMPYFTTFLINFCEKEACIVYCIRLFSTHQTPVICLERTPIPNSPLVRKLIKETICTKI